MRHGRLRGWALPPHQRLPFSHQGHCNLGGQNSKLVPEMSLGVQDILMDARNNFSFGVSFRKCHLTHQDGTCPPSLSLDPWRTGRVPDRSLHFNVSNNSTL